MPQRLGSSACLALAAVVLLLGGCDAMYDDTKGWANRLEASILKAAHDLDKKPRPEGDGQQHMQEQPAEMAQMAAPAAKAPMTPAPAEPAPKNADQTVMKPADPATPGKAAPPVVSPQATVAEPAQQQVVHEPDGLVAETAGQLLAPAPKPETSEKPAAVEAQKVAGAAETPPLPKPKPEMAATKASGKKPATVAKAGTAAKMQPDHAVVLHLSSLRSEAAAKREWADLQHRFPKSLGSMSAEFRRTDLGDKGTFYRVLAGPLPSRAAGKEVCDALKAKRAQQYCRIMPSKPKA